MGKRSEGRFGAEGEEYEGRRGGIMRDNRKGKSGN